MTLLQILKPSCLDTAVAVFVFRRPDTTKRVLEQLSIVKPKRLYVICDGPREGKEREAELQKETLELFANIDWECDVRFNVAHENLGCKNRVVSGIDWVFGFEESAIFLEDDCLPTLDFFYFCESMLHRFRGQDDIGMVSGTRQTLIPNLNNRHVTFTRIPRIWGWATWRDRWESFDADLEQVESRGFQEAAYWGAEGILSRAHWSSRFEESRKDPSIWDAQWVYALWSQRRYSVQPPVNLISNIGFGSGATHTSVSASLFNNWPSHSLTWPLLVAEVKSGTDMNTIDERAALRLESYISMIPAQGPLNLFRVFLLKTLARLR